MNSKDYYPVVVSNILMAQFQIMMLVNEIIKLKYKGPSMYFESFWSIPNCLQFLISSVYNLFKFIDAQNDFTIFSNEEQKYNEFSLITLMMWLNTILISMALFKCLFYMRVYDKFGNFVLLFSRCVLELIPFTCFLFFWLFGFSVLF